MHRFSYCIKKTAGWIAAAFIAVFICNISCFAFYDPCQELTREAGATTGFLLPDSFGVYGLEGYSVADIDHYGYVNRKMERADDYIVVAGASHTEGLFIPEEARYTDVVNDMLFNDGKNHVINIGRSGNYFSVCLQHLDGILGEFPDAKAIVIETDSLAYDTKALYDSMIQTGYDPDETADALLSRLSFRQRMVIRIKQYLPLLRLIRKQYYTYLGAQETAEDNGTDILDPVFWKSEYDGDFETALSDLMKYIRSKTDKQVIILYHPAVKLEDDGSMSALSNHAEPYYEKICRENGIDFIDMTGPFEDAYNKDRIIPYGFANTTPGDGHINKAAHKMMAEELAKVIRW
ncbi:MAG: hypothetical protein IKQ40_02625 [Lachnospiraceae bacterium]|nr:hypothetical protein [Lachnospiraceae bacterium]